MSRIGIQIGASTPPHRLAEIAQRAEGLGYSEMWFAEDYFELGGIATVATALAATDHIPVGLGVVAARVRHAAVTAMEFATVAGAHPGRFMAGLGHGAPGWMRQMALEPASPMGLLREATVGIRKLLSGEAVSDEGEYFEFCNVKLDHPPPGPVPLYYGVQGPASLRLSGELADGTLLGWLSSPSSVKWARREIDQGRKKGGRSDRHEVAALCVLSISPEDPEGAGRALARWAAPMLAAMATGKALSGTPEGEQLAALADRDGAEGLGESIPLDLLRRFAAVGTPDHCADTIAGLLTAGADRVVLVPNPAGFRSTDEMVAQFALAQTLLSGG